MMLESFGVLENDKIKPENSKYANYYIGLLKNLPPQGVLNYSDLFEEQFMSIYVDMQFKISFCLHQSFSYLWYMQDMLSLR